MHRLTIITSLMMLLTSGHLTGQSSKDTSETESQLSTLREDIAAIRTQLDAQEEALDGLQDTLGRTERSIGELNQQLTASTQEKQRLQEKLTSLRNENDVLKEDQIRLEADVEAGILLTLQVIFPFTSGPETVQLAGSGVTSEANVNVLLSIVSSTVTLLAAYPLFVTVIV